MDRKIIYQLTTEDVQNVAINELERELNTNELKIVEDKIGNYIDWYDLIITIINTELVKQE